MKLGGNLPPGYGALPFSISGTGSFIGLCIVIQTLMDIPRPLITQLWTTGEKVEVLRHEADSNRFQFRTDDLSVHSRTCQPPDQDNCPKEGQNIARVLNKGIFSIMWGGGGGWGSSAITAPPSVGHPQGP